MSLPRLGGRNAAAPAGDYPGPQRLVRSSTVGSALMWALLIATGILVVHSILQANVRGYALSEIKLLDTNTSLSLFVALLGLIAARQQFIHGLKPYLTYSSGFEREPARLAKTGDGELWWVVTINNVGSGLAIVQSASYRVSFTRDEALTDYTRGYHAVVEELARHGLASDRDVSLLNITGGAILAPDTKTTLVELTDRAAREIAALDVKLTFESRSGDFYEKEIYCIPRKGVAP